MRQHYLERILRALVRQKLPSWTLSPNLRRYLQMLLIVSLLLTGCNLTSTVPATPTSIAESTAPPSTSTSLPPTGTPQGTEEPRRAVTPAPAGTAVDRQSITALVAAMQADVVAGDKESYLSHMDLTDPIFALEHTRWADGWVKDPPTRFTLKVSSIAPTSTSATASLTISWKMPSPDIGERTATLPVYFTRSAAGSWRFAGEVWVPLQSEHFVVKVQPGLEDVARKLAPELPEVYSHVTAGLAYTPTRNPEIKLYSSSVALVAMTLLNLPEIGGWNEPGEALKFRASSYDPALKGGIAHEFTHYLTFDRAGTAHTRMPWWLDEGLATYLAGRFDPAGRGDERMRQVRRWAEDGTLADWASMSDFEATPLDMWAYVYPQGYAMVRYVTERFGEETRNRWVAAMATDLEIKQATLDILGLPFEALDSDFVDWVKQQ